MNPLEITLGIMTAVGGFVDIGDLVFSVQAGAKFGYSLIWAVLLGTIGIILYSEMSGRIAAVTHQATFTIIPQRLGRRWGAVALTGSMIVNVMTCAAEIGGVALALKLMTALPYQLLVLFVALALALIFWLLPFEGIERVFGLLGLGLLVFVAVALHHGVAWGALAHGLVPTIDHSDPLTYLYFAVGILAATLMPYEVYFYQSGGIEEGWKPGDMLINRMNSIVGFLLGSLVVIALIVVAAQVLMPRGITPDFLGSSLLPAVTEFGAAGLLLALVGVMFAIGGAAMETSLAGAYSLSQYFGWKWGRRNPPLKVPRFTVTWLVMLALSAAIILTGVDPVQLTQYAVIFSVVVMPLTYLPVLLVAKDRRTMGKHVNSPLVNGVAWAYFGLICVVAVAAVPLMVITHFGTR
jgi:manganese transport protein